MASRERQSGCAASWATAPAAASRSDFTFALAHYDFVDVNADEMLNGLTRSMQEALSSHRPLAWA